MKKTITIIALMFVAGYSQAVTYLYMTNVVIAYQSESQRSEYLGRVGEIVVNTSRPDAPMTAYNGVDVGGFPLAGGWSPMTYSQSLANSGTNAAHTAILTGSALTNGVASLSPFNGSVNLLLEPSSIIDLGGASLTSPTTNMVVSSPGGLSAYPLLSGLGLFNVTDSLCEISSTSAGAMIDQSIGGGALRLKGLKLSPVTGLAVSAQGGIVAESCYFDGIVSVGGTSTEPSVFNGCLFESNITNTYASTLGGDITFNDCSFGGTAKYGSTFGNETTFNRCHLALYNTYFCTPLAGRWTELTMYNCYVENADFLFDPALQNIKLTARGTEFISAGSGWTVNDVSEFWNCKGVSSGVTNSAATIIGCTDENGAAIPNQ